MSRSTRAVVLAALGTIGVALPTSLQGTTRTPRPTSTPSSLPELPDLVVESARITAPGYTGGCTSSPVSSLGLEICIRNQGAASGAFNLTVNGEHFARVDGIDAGDAMCVFGRYTYPDDTTIFLDDENEVEESDESNNLTTRFVAIPSRPPTCTAAPTATPTPTPTLSRPPCPGDCNGDGEVTVNELIVGVNIALDRAPLSSCPAFEIDCRDACVHMIVDAVNALLRGCP